MLKYSYHTYVTVTLLAIPLLRHYVYYTNYVVHYASSLTFNASRADITKHQMKKLENLYGYLLSDPNEFPMSGGGANPEEFLKKMLAPNVEFTVDENGQLCLDTSQEATAWELAYDDGNGASVAN